MKPAPFHYVRAETLEHALGLLAEHGDDAKVIAGGQSLVAVMNFRLARPDALVDIDRLPGLSYVLAEGDALRIGALTRHAHIERYPGALGGYEILPQAAAFVGHYPIRTRGTFGGSIAHADPAAEWVLLATLLDAQMELTSLRGTRTVGAADFFDSYFTTAMDAEELLTEVRFDRGVSRSAVTEFARRHGDFAVVSTAAGYDLDADGAIVGARLAAGGVASTALRLTRAEAVLEGERPGPRVFAAAASAAAAEVDPPSDMHGDADYRRQLTRTLLHRALTEADDVRI